MQKRGICGIGLAQLSRSHDVSSSTRNSGRDVDPELFGQEHILPYKHEREQFSADESRVRSNTSKIFLAREKQIPIELGTEFVQSQPNYRAMCVEHE